MAQWYRGIWAALAGVLLLGMVARGAQPGGVQFLYDKNLVIDEKGSHFYPLEAESFTCKGGGWSEQWQGYFTASPNVQSRNLLVADATATPARATRTVQIRQAGDYHLFIRYLKPYGFGTVFGIRLEQKGRVLLDKRYGYKGDVVLDPWRGRGAIGEWMWHNTDPVYTLAEQVTLAAGKLTLTLYKDQNEGPGARREIDLLLLTNDLAMQPLGSVFGSPRAWDLAVDLNKFRTPLWYKVVLDEKPAKPVQVSVADQWMTNGYWMGLRHAYRLGKADGKLSWLADGVPGDVNLVEAVASPWQRLDLATVETPTLTVTRTGPAVKARFLIANGEPCEKHVIWSGWVAGSEPFEVLVPISHGFYEYDSLLAKGKPVLYADLLADQTARLNAYHVDGRPPKLFAACGYPGHTGLALHQALGMNAAFSELPMSIYAPEAAKRLGTNTHFFYPNDGPWDDPKNLEKLKVERENSPTREMAYNYKMIEEGGADSLQTLAKSDAQQAAFRAFVREQGADPLTLLTPQAFREAAGKNLSTEELWQRVKLGAGSIEESLVTPELYYYSIYFRGWAHAEQYREKTARITKVFPQDRTNPGSSLWSDGYDIGLSRGIDPFLCFRRGAFTSYCSENSWGRDAASYLGPQSMSYEACLARALAKYGDFPPGAMTTYLITSGVNGYGVNKEYIPLQGLCGFSQGLDTFWYYFIGRDCSTTLFHEQALRGIKAINYAIGAVEDDILGARAKVVKAPVALGWSISTDIWDLTVRPRFQDGDMNLENNVYPQERQLLYLLLRHCQAPVDILDERDIEDGALDGYKVYVLAGDHFSRKAAAKLAAWVQSGGTVISVAGGGLRDEFNRDNPAMLALFGITASPLTKVDVGLRPKCELVHRSPLETAYFPEGTVDYYGYMQQIALEKGSKANVLVKNYRGNAAVTANTVGQGKAILCGFLPGMAYVKPAIPAWPFGRGGSDTRELSGFIPTQYSPVVRAIFKRLLTDAGAVNPVECSEPLVEPTLWKGQDGKYRACLVNVSLKPIAKLEIRTHGLDYRQVVDAATGKKVAGAEQTFAIRIERFKVLRFE